jgi:hypothetical protein
MLTVPLPESRLSVYLVPTCAPPAAPAEAAAEQVRRHLRAPLRDRTLQLLESTLRIEVAPVDEFPALEAPWLAAFGADDAQLRNVRAATHAIAVVNTYAPAGPAAHLWAGRAVAYALGTGLGAPVVDEALPRLVDAEQLGRSLPDAAGVVPLASWITALHSPDEHGYWCTTFGLARFGLPDLQAVDVPLAYGGLWPIVLTGLAQRLVEIWGPEIRARPGAPAAELPEVVTVSAADIRAAYGRSPAGRGAAELRLRLDVEGPSNPPFLTVVDPDHAAVCDALFALPDL